MLLIAYIILIHSLVGSSCFIVYVTCMGALCDKPVSELCVTYRKLKPHICHKVHLLSLVLNLNHVPTQLITTLKVTVQYLYIKLSFFFVTCIFIWYFLPCKCYPWAASQSIDFFLVFNLVECGLCLDFLILYPDIGRLKAVTTLPILQYTLAIFSSSDTPSLCCIVFNASSFCNTRILMGQHRSLPITLRTRYSYFTQQLGCFSFLLIFVRKP